MTTIPAEGGCRCGTVRLRIDAPPLLTMACHCRGCQRMTASAFSLSVAVPVDGFAVTAGEPVIGGLHGASRHYHCPHCKSWLFTRPEDVDWFVNVRTTMLDDVMAWPAPFMETFTAEKLPWVEIAVQHSYAGLPAPNAYEALLAGYAASRSY